MKIKNHKKREYRFFPYEKSILCKGRCYSFKYKSQLMKFLTSNLSEAINGEVQLHESGFGYSGPIRLWFVWYNQKQYRCGADIKAELRQLYFRGKKYIHKRFIVSKVDKKYFAFSDKVINLMCHIQDSINNNNNNNDNNINTVNAKNLLKLFEKRGYKDFNPTTEEWTYINGHISDGIDFFYWSDRCNWLRCKTIIEYFKRNNLL